MATLSLDDGRLWYDDTGDGRPLVFVHGGWTDSDAWRRQVARFADEYRIVTVDVRGHGETGATGRRRYSIDLFADDLEAILAHLDVERPVLCGLSLGSMVVQEFLARHPDRAAGAILAGPVRSMPPYDLPQGVKPFVSPMPGLTASLAATDSTTAFRGLLAAVRLTIGRPWLTLTPAVREQSLAAVGSISRSEFRKIFGALYAYDPPDLSHVRTPTLVLYGEAEAPAVKLQGERIAEEVAAGVSLSVPGAGHLVNQDNSEAFNTASAEFLDRIEADV